MRTQSKQPFSLKRGKTRVTGSRLVTVSHLIGLREWREFFLDQSQSEVSEIQCILGLLQTFNGKLLYLHFPFFHLYFAWFLPKFMVFIRASLVRRISDYGKKKRYTQLKEILITVLAWHDFKLKIWFSHFIGFLIICMNNIVCDFETKNIYFCSKIKIFFSLLSVFWICFLN